MCFHLREFHDLSSIKLHLRLYSIKLSAYRKESVFFLLQRTSHQAMWIDKRFDISSKGLIPEHQYACTNWFNFSHLWPSWRCSSQAQGVLSFSRTSQLQKQHQDPSCGLTPSLPWKSLAAFYRAERGGDMSAPSWRTTLLDVVTCKYTADARCNTVTQGLSAYDAITQGHKSAVGDVCFSQFHFFK